MERHGGSLPELATYHASPWKGRKIITKWSHIWLSSSSQFLKSYKFDCESGQVFRNRSIAGCSIGVIIQLMPVYKIPHGILSLLLVCLVIWLSGKSQSDFLLGSSSMESLMASLSVFIDIWSYSSFVHCNLSCLERHRWSCPWRFLQVPSASCRRRCSL